MNYLSDTAFKPSYIVLKQVIFTFFGHYKTISAAFHITVDFKIFNTIFMLIIKQRL